MPPGRDRSLRPRCTTPHQTPQQTPPRSAARHCAEPTPCATDAMPQRIAGKRETPPNPETGAAFPARPRSGRQCPEQPPEPAAPTAARPADAQSAAHSVCASRLGKNAHLGNAVFYHCIEVRGAKRAGRPEYRNRLEDAGLAAAVVAGQNIETRPGRQMQIDKIAHAPGLKLLDPHASQGRRRPARPRPPPTRVMRPAAGIPGAS